VQVDFSQPEKFELEYIDRTGARVRPVIIHRAILGSLERFFAVLLEHYKGALPFWLSPEQIRILTITDGQREYAAGVLRKLKEQKIRVSFDDSSDQISAKIKRAQLEKIPMMLVIGKKEEAQNTVTIRYRDGEQKMGVTMDQLVELITEIR
jgi:threonyl-tRNA synthetase